MEQTKLSAGEPTLRGEEDNGIRWTVFADCCPQASPAEREETDRRLAVLYQRAGFAPSGEREG